MTEYLLQFKLARVDFIVSKISHITEIWKLHDLTKRSSIQKCCDLSDALRLTRAKIHYKRHLNHLQVVGV